MRQGFAQNGASSALSSEFLLAKSHTIRNGFDQQVDHRVGDPFSSQQIGCHAALLRQLFQEVRDA